MTATHTQHPQHPAATPAPHGRALPSRRTLAVLVAFVFTGGIVAGAALAPAPATSLADNSTIVQRVIALLAAQAGEDSQGTAPASSPAASSKLASTSSANAPTARHTAEAASKAPAEAPTPSSSSSSESSSSGASTMGSEGPSASHANEGRPAPAKTVRLPPIQHVWLVMLAPSTFTAAVAAPASYPYLAGQLLGQGTLLTSYSALDAYELAGDATLLPGGVGASLSVITEPGCDVPTTPGTSTPCSSSPPSPPEADAFLQHTVAPILSGPAFHEDGLVVITFASTTSDAGAPAATLALQPAAGALLLSPLLHPGAKSPNPFNSLSPRTSLQTIFRH